ncbi:MAG: hypothetical protein MJZ48_03445 [Paludibacteraceae bacterium]|nr:hypothetical protein [Paludibacteraceae bacterium]
MKKRYVQPHLEVFDFRSDPMMEGPTYIWPVSPAGVDQSQFMTSTRVVSAIKFWM